MPKIARFLACIEFERIHIQCTGSGLWGSAVSSSSGIPGGDPAANEFAVRLGNLQVVTMSYS